MKAKYDLGLALATDTACVVFDAAVQTHGRYFKEQQEAERSFISQLTHLCDDVALKAPAARKMHYYSLLHARLRMMRLAINRHVNAAFYVKSACASIREGRVGNSSWFNWTALPEEVEAAVGADSMAYTYAKLRYYRFCANPIFDHEPFNLAEGRFIANLSTHLLRVGLGSDGLCSQRQDHMRDIVHIWEVQLEDQLAMHRSNHAFDSLLTAVGIACGQRAEERSAVLNAPSNPVRLIGPQVEDVVAALNDQLSESAVRPNQLCRGAMQLDVRTFSDVIGNESVALIGAAVFLLTRRGQTHCGGEEESGRSRSMMAHALGVPALEDLLNESTHLSSRYNANLTCSNQNCSLGAANVIVSILLSTVYHKYVPLCPLIRFPTSVETVEELFGSASGQAQITKCSHPGSARSTSFVFDIAPSQRCTGSACVRAADALGGYGALLDLITRLRNLLYLEQDNGMSCLMLGRIEAAATEVSSRVFPTQTLLRMASQELEMSCVAPPRELALSVGAQPRNLAWGAKHWPAAAPRKLLKAIGSDAAKALEGDYGGIIFCFRFLDYTPHNQDAHNSNHDSSARLDADVVKPGYFSC